MNKLKQAIQLIESNQWDESHTLVQDGKNKYFYLIHGLLHRIEGDMSNAQYWYDKAEESMPNNTNEEETKRLKLLVENEN